MPRSQQIWKFQITETEEVCHLGIPAGSTFLDAGIQKDRIVCLWFLVEVSAPVMRRSFRVYNTGEDIENPDGLNFLRTVTYKEGKGIWHIFEVITPDTSN